MDLVLARDPLSWRETHEAMGRARRFRRKSGKRNGDSHKPTGSNSSRPKRAKDQLGRSEARSSQVISEPASGLEGPVNTYGDVFAAGSSQVVMGDLKYTTIFVTKTASSTSSSPQRLSRNESPMEDIPPVGVFERFPSFRPDKYTDRTADVTLNNYSGYEIAQSMTSQTHLLTFLYRPELQNVIHITLSLTIDRSSKYWGLILSDVLFSNTSFSIFNQFLPQLARWLRNKKPERQLLRLQGRLHNNFTIDESDEHWDLATERYTQMRSGLFNLFSTVRHWQCPWYYEDELRRRELFKDYRGSSFLVYVIQERQWACETRFCPDETKFERQYYNLRALHCLRLGHCPGIVCFFGVVRDSSDCVVGFLTELPARGRFHRAMRKADRIGRSVSRFRRERWCMQIVRAVAEIHRRTLVIGMLCQRMDGIIGLDDQDNAVLLPYLRSTISEDDRCIAAGMIPPELRNAFLPIQVTPEIDLFQLGLVLWRIAGNKLGEDRPEFCLSSGCQASINEICYDPHTNPIALPMAEDEFSVEMRRIINICRSEDARERLPAQVLLALFPKSLSTSHKRDRIRNFPPSNMRPEEYQELWGNSTGCSNCGRDCTDLYFHCTLCESNDFDLCEYCVATGCHCFDEQHHLVEVRAGCGQHRIISSVKSSGHREETVL